MYVQAKSETESVLESATVTPFSSNPLILQRVVFIQKYINVVHVNIVLFVEGA